MNTTPNRAGADPATADPTGPALARGGRYRALVRAEAYLMTRQAANMVWLVLAVAAVTVLALLPAAREPVQGWGATSLLGHLQPLLVLICVVLLSVTVLP